MNPKPESTKSNPLVSASLVDTKAQVLSGAQPETH